MKGRRGKRMLITVMIISLARPRSVMTDKEGEVKVRKEKGRTIGGNEGSEKARNISKE